MQKYITIEGIDVPIILARRKGARSLRLSAKSNGEIRITVPYGIPEFLAKRFIIEKRQWIEQHKIISQSIQHGCHIGKNHRVIIEPTTAARHTTKVTETEIKLLLPENAAINSKQIQKALITACEKALLLESSQLLLQRLADVSKKTGIPYKSGVVKKLKSRWGACDNFGNITLNSYLIQLDWSLIDYVISHELAHTIHHHHQKQFWDLVSELYPDYKNARKILKSKPTDIYPTSF